MTDAQYEELKERLERIEGLLLNIQPKKRKPRQTKIPETRSLEDQMQPYKRVYAPSILRDFWLYWSQQTKSGKERWELEKVFDLPKRLETWKRNEDKWQWEKEQKEALKKVNEKPVHRKKKESETYSEFD